MIMMSKTSIVVKPNKKKKQNTEKSSIKHQDKHFAQ